MMMLATLGRQFLGTFVGNPRAFLLAILAVILVITGSFAYIKTIQARHYREIFREYSVKITQLERAVLLTEDLRRDNAKLIQERDDLLEDLRHAEGYETPLPSGIRALVQRVQRDQTGTE